MRLLVAFQAGGAPLPVDAAAILAGIRATQIKDGPARGGFRWYAEEPSISDDHAVFFNGMALACVWALHRDQLSARCAEELELILREMRGYALSRAAARGVYYPNEYLGYLLCAWLCSEFFALKADRDEMLSLLELAADYWLEDGWGWGEHLSDIYGGILLDELSLFILLTRELPEQHLFKLKRLLAELLALEDYFGSGPRVPAVRSYAFSVSPRHTHYRELVQPLPAEATFRKAADSGDRLDTCCTPYLTASGGRWTPLGHALHALGWHGLALPEAARRSVGVFECAGAATAWAHVESDMRLGSLSRFPLMPSMERVGAGLAWQCFPVCFWRAGGEWGYFQWETVEGGLRRAHPAEDKKFVPERRRLTDATVPPIAGFTYALQRGPEAVVLRVMPAASTAWEELSDRFRLLGCNAAPHVEPLGPAVTKLSLRCGGRTVEIFHFALWDSGRPELERCNDFLDWVVRRSGIALKSCGGRVADLWAISLNGGITAPPQVAAAAENCFLPRTSAERAWTVRWKWPGTEWHIVTDPLAAAPLRQAEERQ